MKMPLHILEGNATEWERWFAWRPVKSEQGFWIWLRSTWRRRFFPPIWFCPPAPYDGWLEFSDERLSFWDSAAMRSHASAIRAAVSKKTAESGHSPSTHNSESE